MAPELPDHLHGTFASAGNPIFSVDVDPSGKRLVTCGQDNKIKIWSTSPILSDQAEAQGEAIFPRLLATLTDHLGAVNVARFAPLGLDARPYLGSSIAKAATIHASSPPLLASGADDKLICIYELKPGPGRAAFGTKDTPNLENWKQVALMRGHDANVTDLSWSPDARSIASSSLDNLVIIWEVRTGQRLHTLSQHHGYVKGVAWDPFNSYLATQGELDGVYIWRLDQLDKPIAHITTMLTDSPSAGFHSRLSWSPDGQTLAATNGYSAPSHVSVLIKRKDWSAELNLAGHKGPVVVARHNPRFVHPQRESRPSEVRSMSLY